MIRPINTRVLLLTALLLGALTSWAQADEKPNIIWECGQNVPNSAYWKKYGAELEAMLPFDGVMLSMEYPVTEEGRLGVAHDRRPTWKVLKRPEITEEMTGPFVEDMLAAHLTKKHNVVNVWLGTGWPYLDFFDDALWETIQNNIRVVAKASRDAGCAGLVFDPEQYGGNRCWKYSTNAPATKVDKPYEEFVVTVRQRGREFGKALSEGYPDCTLLFFFGHSWPAYDLKEAVVERGAKGLEDAEESNLYAPFLDGMLEGTSNGTIFVDGMEYAYSFTTAEDFKEGRWMALHVPLTFTTVPDLFRKKVRCGFGLWMDNARDGFWWHPFDPEKNRYSPGRLQRTIHLALKYGDGYVWLWNESPNWYVDGPLGKPHSPAVQQSKAYGMVQAYRDAVREAKAWPGLDTTLPTTYQLADDETLGFVDREELEQLLTRTEKVMNLPNDGWRFRPDHNRVGVKEGWYAAEVPGEGWDDFAIGEFWERVGDKKHGGLDGVAWYRREIEFKDVPEDKKLYLHFGAVDESLHLWIDGTYVACYDRGPWGWDKPFAIDVTDFITSGKHTLAIWAHDMSRMGGIWKGVTFIAE